MSDIAESFASSLSELTVNSKPHINMLTMLADDHLEFAPIITKTVLAHLQKVRPEVKLPVLYLIDSIVKNVGKGYINHFTQAIVQHFTNTFEKVDEKTREQMFKLRQTWSDVFPAKTMYALDTEVQKIDPAWPKFSNTPTPSTVHLNPKFFKTDIIDSKSLSSTIKRPESDQSRHRKTRTNSSRSRSLTHSSQSKKAPPSSTSGNSEPVTAIVKPTPSPEQLREQVIMKQKMLLELQQQKLKLELLQTQARLEEQQKQLEKQSSITRTAKHSLELDKITEMMDQEQAKLKAMNRSLKKRVNLKFPKLQQIHQVTKDMKAQTVGDISKMGTSFGESLLKPSALLELGKDDQLNIKPSKTLSTVLKPSVFKMSIGPQPVVPPKSKITQLQQAAEKQKILSQADSTEEATPPVRIAPVSSQLINAALSYGRNVRDPRIRQMSSRLESQMNPQLQAPSPLQPQPPVPPPPAVPSKVPPAEHSQEGKSYVKSRKDKKPSNHQRTSKSSEDDSKHLSKSGRSNDRSSSRSSSKPDKLSPSKKSQEKSERKSKIEDLFSSTRSKSPMRISTSQSIQNVQSPSKSYHKKEQSDSAEIVDPPLAKPPLIEKGTRTESSPKRPKLQDIWQGILSGESSVDADLLKQEKKLKVLDIAKAQSTKNETPKAEKPISPELSEGVAEMPYEDIEKIVKHPDIVSKTNKVTEVKSKVEDSLESSKSSDDSTEAKFDDIIKNPTKQISFDKISRANEDKFKSTQSALFDFPSSVTTNHQADVGLVIKSDGSNKEASSVSSSSNKVEVENYIEKDIKPDSQAIDNQSENKEKETVILRPPQGFSSLTIDCSHLNENIFGFGKNLPLSEEYKQTDIENFHKLTVEEEITSTVNTKSETFDQTIENQSIDSLKSQIESFLKEEVVSTETSLPKVEEYTPSDVEMNEQSHSSGFVNSSEEPINNLTQVSFQSVPQMDTSKLSDSLPSIQVSERLTLSPKRVPSPINSVELMETIEEACENSTNSVDSSSQGKSDKRNSPVHQEKKIRKGDKPVGIIMEQIAEAEKHAASPSPPPPPIISDKFKEIKQSSLSRLRRVGRTRDDNIGSESPEPADVDLRPQIQAPTLTKDLKNEVLGLADKDVDLRNLPQSPTKKRPSMEKLLDLPPAKKSKAEVMDDCASDASQATVGKIRYFPARPDSTHWYNFSRICVYKRLFGSEDVDLRPVLCPPPPSPPPPPIISSPPPADSAGDRAWAHYKKNKPDTYRPTKYTPTRRNDRTPSVDKFSRNIRLHSSDGGGGWPGSGLMRSRSTQEDVDMRAQPPGGTDGSYNHIIMQAFEQHKRGDLNADAYKRVLSEVFSMREKRQLEEAQRRDEEEAAQAETLEPISDDDISGGSLSGVEDAPSPSESYSGTEDIDDSSIKRSKTEDKLPEPTTTKDHEAKENMGDVDIRVLPTDIDIRKVFDFPPHIKVDDKTVEEKQSRKQRGDSPYSRKSSDIDKDQERYRSRREDQKARREKRARRIEEERDSRYRKSRFSDEVWSESGKGQVPSESMELDSSAPRVPPLPHYQDHPPQPRFDATELHDNSPMRPTSWEPQRMAGPTTPWMGPPVRGPPVLGIRPQDRFMPPRWRQPGPGPMFEGPTPRFNRFGPPPLGRFPVPLVPCEVPPSDPAVLKAIQEDPTKSINIDGVPRDIRFYGITAVALMSWDDPREVTFQTGHRRVIIDDRESILVHFNAPPVEMLIDGKPRRIRFGAPTRELYIDNQWFEVFFGGPPVTCDIGGQPHSVKLEGPPPPVRPTVQRKDLVLGKITLIVDAEYFFTVYLDAKPQKFEVKGVAYIIRFVEALQKTVINGVAFKSDFGGLPRPIILNGMKHFFRLTALPRGVTPGFLTIVNMEGGRLPSPPTLPAPPQLPASLEQAVDFKADLPADQFLQPPINLLTAPPRLSPEMVPRVETAAVLHPPNVPPPVTPALHPNIPPPAVNSLDMLTNLMPAAEPSRAVDYSYAVDNENTSLPATSVTTNTNSVVSTAPTMATATATGEINVSELLQKLMATGIVPSLEQPKPQDKPLTSDPSPLIKPVDFRKPETLKIRQSALVSHLYSGIQCNSCGVRFPPEQTMKYSQHLDWHFRQNRRDKDSSRMAQTRRYYYDVNDWVQFEEIEDLEERAQPWFEMQEGAGGGDEEEVPQVLVSVRAADYPEDAACHICHDKFESFYNEEKEEWQLRNAVDQEGKLVHPLCLEDQRVAAEKPIIVEDIDITGEDEPKEEEEIQEIKSQEEPPAKVEEDDDIMEVVDIEFVKPVFPVEDLTVSDNEDDKEEKQELLEDKKEEAEVMETEKDKEEPTEENITSSEIKDSEQEGQKEEPEKAEEETKDEDATKDEDTQDDLVLLDKGEDSALSTAEIMEVVRNIKKDPDTLGGEYEDIGLDHDIEIKKEKGEVPLPAPVVDTTHTTVTCLIDGNVEFEETSQQINVGGPPKIKINITKPSVLPAPKEAKESESEVTEAESPNPVVPPTFSLVNQPPPPGEEPVPQARKPRLIGRKLQELPPTLKGSELSGLCSIM